MTLPPPTSDENVPAAPDLSIVIVNMNAADFLETCLETVRQHRDGLEIEILLVDNASTDDSVERARRVWPELVCLRQSENIGYVAANNRGVARARGRHLMFLNNDTELHAGCLSQLVDFLDEHPKAGAVSPTILNPDGSEQGTSRNFPTIANGIFGRRSVLSQWFPDNRWSRHYMLSRHHRGDEPFSCEILSAACIAMPSSLAREIGGMDEDFGLYWVDAEMCSRLRRLGYRIYCVPSASLVHHEGHGGSTRTFRQRLRATWGFHRDAYLVYVKALSLSALDPRRILAAVALPLRAAILTVALFLRPGRATSSGGRN